MKKIMIAMGAVMSLALGAWAADPAVPGGTMVSYMPFDGMTLGSTLDPTAADSVANVIGYGEVHWELRDGAVCESVITNDASHADDLFLSIDQTDTLYRLMNEKNSAETNVVSGGQGIYFASRVQFTASDETNSVSLVSQSEGDKLLIWLQAADFDDDGNVDGTNLIITASSTDNAGAAPADYVITNATVEPGTFYSLVVKATYDATGIKFTVLLNDVVLAADGDKTLFASLVASTYEAGYKITKVGFKGTGAVDDLEFGTFQTAQKKYFAIGDEEYPTLSEAVNHANAGDVIKVLDDYGMDKFALQNGQSLIIDLAGHTISNESDAAINVAVGSSLIITNSTVKVGSVETGDPENAYAIENFGSLTIYGGRYKGGIQDSEDDGVDPIVYYVNNNVATTSELVEVTEDNADDYGADNVGYWVIDPKSGPVPPTQVTAYLSLNPAEATYDENKASPGDYTQVTVVFSNDTEQVNSLVLDTDYTITWSADEVVNAYSNYFCTVTSKEGSAYTFNTVTGALEVTALVQTFEVTFSTNETVVAEYTTNVVANTQLAADKIPAFTGGTWDVDPTNAVITCNTNFNYTISGSNWPEAWNDNNEPASMKGVFDAWIAVPGNDPTAENAEAAFLSGVDVADYTNDFAVATIAIVNGKVQLTGNYDLSEVNGAILLLTGDTPSTFTTTNAVEKSATIEITPELGETKKFYKLVLGYPAN